MFPSAFQTNKINITLSHNMLREVNKINDFFKKKLLTNINFAKVIPCDHNIFLQIF